MSGMGALAQKIESLQKENAERSEIDKAQCKLIQKLRAQLAIAIEAVKEMSECDHPTDLIDIREKTITKISQKPVESTDD